MQLVKAITINELKEMSERMYQPLIKAVVDIERGLVVVDAPMHADEELFLLDQGSNQEDLWGINLYPDCYGEDDFVEFDSMINIRPSRGNRSRFVEDANLQKRIIEIVLGAISD